MRFMLIALTVLMSSLAHAEWHDLPDAEISARTIGGTVLMVQMKYSLVIDGYIQEKLNQELGEAGRKNLFKDIILSKDVAYLKTTYCSDSRVATNQVVKMYESLTANKAQELSLN